MKTWSDPDFMLAMRLHAPGEALRAERVPVPEPGPGQVLIEVAACGVCRTDLHVVDGDLTEGKYPLVPGHEIVGRVVRGGTRFAAGVRVGVPWLGWTCGRCEYCASGRENLCGEARFTGYTLDGGYAGYAVADERFCFALPERYGDAEAAPLLVRRADRLPLVRIRGRGAHARPVRLRRRRAPARAGGEGAGTKGFRLYETF